MHESVPLHRVHETIFEFCRERPDVVVFGAQAVNLHVADPRMTQDVDLLCFAPGEVAEELAGILRAKLHMATRVREVHRGRAYRVYQSRKDGNRHLADLRRIDFPVIDTQELDRVRYTGVTLTTAMKVCAFVKRRLAPKGATDLADLRRLLLAHPELREPDGAVVRAIEAVGGNEPELNAWRELLAEPLVSDEEADDGY